jgi:DNA (cytosine-5)-methyltransferase 1
MAGIKLNRRTKKHRQNSRPKFIAVDFFCGAGGTTRGLIDAGGYVIAGIDKDFLCAKTYIQNNPNKTFDKRNPEFLHYDIFPKTLGYPSGQQRELYSRLDKLIASYRSKGGSVPLLFAICAPCQPFTRLSRSPMTERRLDRRTRDMNLLLQACRFVRRYRPELVLSENVASIRDPKYGGVWDDFRRRLSQLGYSTGSKVVCTSRFGIPQFRKRSILTGVRKQLIRVDRFADLLADELLVPESNPNTMTVSVAEALSHLPPLAAGAAHPTIPNHRTRTLSEMNLKRLASAKPGESNAYLEDTKHGDLSLECHRKVNRKLRTRCFSDVYTRMHPNRPSPTITTKCHSISNGRFGHYDVSQLRGISLREAAILQSFPEDYVFYPNDQIDPIARMIGNAVPPKLAAFFANYLVNSLDVINE